MTSYPTPAFTRPALAPGVIAAIVLVAGAALTGTPAFIWILFAVSILALIVCVYAVQAGQWWWLVAFAPIAIAWNPVIPLTFTGIVWESAHFVAALAFIAAGLLVKVPNAENRNRSARR